MPSMRAQPMSGPLLCGLVFSLCVAALWGCEDDLDPGVAPVVEAIRPSSAAPGGTITLVGRRFGLQGPFDAVYLGGVEAPVVDWADRAIRLEVPDDGRRGQLELVVKSEGRVSQPVAFEVVLPIDDGDAQADAGIADAGP